MRREQVLEAEVSALRSQLRNLEKELERVTARPIPSLMMYGYDVDDIVAAIEDRGVHPSETKWLAEFIRALADGDARVD